MADSSVLVTGGAGFLGCHLIDRLLAAGKQVIALDILWTGSRDGIRKFESHPAFRFIEHDVVHPFPDDLPRVNEIYHLACPASPIQFPQHPARILHTCYMGTKNAFDFAVQHSAKVLITSSSEVYGDSQVHPQAETYFGNVNPFGPRSCYDEGKRVAEALAYAYRKEQGLQVRIARVFNAYGPGMSPDDGRVVANFIVAALQGQPLVIYGDGKSSRSFQYVDDCVRGLEMLMQSDVDTPVNIGNESETTVGELAVTIRDLVAERTGRDKVEIVFREKRENDPVKRVPDARRARELLGWTPRVDLKQGLERSFAWYQEWYAAAVQDSSTGRMSGGKL